MKLVVSTPLAVVLDVSGVAHLRAEDETGAFGIMPGHADFLTALRTSVITWRDSVGTEHYVAVQGGILTVQGGQTIIVATRDAVAGDDLRSLETDVLAEYKRRSRNEQVARTDTQRLYLSAVRRLLELLRLWNRNRGGRGPSR